MLALEPRVRRGDRCAAGVLGHAIPQNVIGRRAVHGIGHGLAHPWIVERRAGIVHGQQHLTIGGADLGSDALLDVIKKLRVLHAPDHVHAAGLQSIDRGDGIREIADRDILCRGSSPIFVANVQLYELRRRKAGNFIGAGPHRLGSEVIHAVWRHHRAGGRSHGPQPAIGGLLEVYF